MEASELTPIIFIPGLMGSIGGEMLGCQVKWSFGMASWFYKPFIKELEKLGYKLNEDLFICYYDWRKSCNEIVKEYLQPLMYKVGKEFPNQKIDLLCHSMGGVVARTYIQGLEYSYNIRNLMCFGTPNKGNIEAYYLWSIGKVMKNTNKKMDLFEIIRRGYIWVLSKVLDIPLGKESIEKLHSSLEGVGDLIPSDDYGEILCYKFGDNYIYIPRRYTMYTNNLLNRLNKEIDILHRRVENTYCFIGTKNETDKVLILDKEPLFEYKKGYVIGSLKTTEGDGTVTVSSASIDGAEMFIMEGSHSGILKDSIKYIADIYSLEQSPVNINSEEPKEYPLGIIFKKYTNLELKNGSNIIGKSLNGTFITEYDHIYQEFEKDYLWVMLKDIPMGEYRLGVTEEHGDDPNIVIIGPTIEVELTRSNLKKATIDTLHFDFKV